MKLLKFLIVILISIFMIIIFEVSNNNVKRYTFSNIDLNKNYEIFSNLSNSNIEIITSTNNDVILEIEESVLSKVNDEVFYHIVDNKLVINQYHKNNSLIKNQSNIKLYIPKNLNISFASFDLKKSNLLIEGLSIDKIEGLFSKSNLSLLNIKNKETKLTASNGSSNFVNYNSESIFIDLNKSNLEMDSATSNNLIEVNSTGLSNVVFDYVKSKSFQMSGKFNAQFILDLKNDYKIETSYKIKNKKLDKQNDQYLYQSGENVSQINLLDLSSASFRNINVEVE